MSIIEDVQILTKWLMCPIIYGLYRKEIEKMGTP